MPKQLSKNREWEKERRDRLNNSFANINKLLPNYDPSINRSKADILHKAAEYIQELQDKVKSLLANDDKYKPLQEEIKKFHHRVKKLLTRNEQLSKLLQDAGIRVPSECGSVKKFKDRKKWAHKITPEQAKIIVEKFESQKENNPKIPKVKTKNKAKINLNQSSKINNKSNKLGIKGARNINNLIYENTLKQADSQACYIINNIPNTTVSLSTTTVVTNTAIFSTPLVTSTVKPANSKANSKSNTTLNALGPGTLILANGNIVPILPQAPILPPQAIIHSSPIIVNPTPTNNTTLFIVPNNINNNPVNSKNVTTAVSSSSISSKISTILSKNYSNIKPKSNITKTTQINKVPIPALSSQFAINHKSKAEKGLQKKVTDKTALNKTDVSVIKKDDDCKNKKKRIIIAKKDITNKRLKTQELENSNIPDNTQIKIDSNKKTNTSSYTIDSLCNENNSNKNESKKLDLPNENIPNINSISTKKVAKDVCTLSNNAIAPPELSTSEETVKNGEIGEIPSKETPQDEKTKMLDDPKTSENEPNNLELIPEEKSGITSKLNDVDKIKTPQNQIVINPDNDLATIKEKSNVKTSLDIVDKNDTLKTDLKPQEEKPTNNKVIPNKPEIHNNQNLQAKSIQLTENIVHSDLSNDLFAHLQVPAGSQNPESTSPTAAFLLAFPLVSSLTGVKVTEVMEDEATDSCNETPTLLQIGTMDTTKPIQTQSESLTPNLLNLDSFTFFSSKDMCNNFYQPFENPSTANCVATTTNSTICETQKSENKPQIVVNSTKASYEQTTLPSQSIATTKFETNTKPIYSTANISTMNVKQIEKINEKPIVNDSFAVESNPTTLSSHVYNTLYSQSYCNMQINSLTSNVNKIQPQNKNKSTDSKSSCRQYSSNKSYPNEHYNTFNPFTDISKSTSCCYDTTKSFNEPFYSSNTNYNYNYQSEINFDAAASYNQMKTAKNDRQNYGSTYDPSYLDYKNLEISNNLNSSFYNHAIPNDKTKNSTKPNKTTVNQPRPPVNWMTTPDIKQSNDILVTPFNKDIDFPTNSVYSSTTFVTNPQSTYFNTNSTIYSSADIQNNFDNRKSLDSSFPSVTTNPFPRSENEDNHFPWSPTKFPQLLEPPGFVSSTLPTLVGDLALGNTSQLPFNEQKLDVKHSQRPKENLKRSKPPNYETQSNFLSVSQLVDHNKSGPPVPNANRVSSRRNSGNRSIKPTPAQKHKRSHKHSETKDTNSLVIHNFTGNNTKSGHIKHPSYNQETTNNGNDWIGDNKQINRHNSKSTSSYSAEALIGNQNITTDNVMTKSRHNQQHNNFPISSKSLNVPPFLTDNILPYFPTVDLPTQDNNFIQQNSSYQTNSFTHNFSTTNTYSTSSLIQTTITSNYLPSSNFIPEITPHEYNPMITDNVNIFSHSNTKPNDNKIYKNVANKQVSSHITNRSDDKRHLSQSNNCSSNNNNVSNVFNKKVKRKISNENNLPGFVDFSFLSMPSAINSPILPDDFHTHSNFLPPPPTPTQLYPCKNPLYSKQSDMPSSSLLPLSTVSRNNMQIDISPSMNNVGPSLTNFNLSAIFPEINKSSTLNDFNSQKNYFPSTSQNHFSSKPTFTSSYINTTQSFSS